MALTYKRRWIGALAVFGAILAGCGGQSDFGNFGRSLGGDIGTGYNGALGTRQSGVGANAASTGVVRGSYPRIETSFQLDTTGDPFDFETNNVVLTLKRPDGSSFDAPCFYDGDKTWRMRYTPLAPGSYSVVSVKRNNEIAHEDKLEKRDWNVTGDPQPGFVRLDRSDKTRFVFDNGARYFPLGHNFAWTSKTTPDYAGVFAKMHTAGENWSRVWMTHWDGKNLDWPQDFKPGANQSANVSGSASEKTANVAKAESPVTDATKSDPTGQGQPDRAGATQGTIPAGKFPIDLSAAKKWDAVIDAAGANGIYFQMCLQHHGQYSSKSGYKSSSNTDPNWEDNPYNVKNGGFLNSPEEFFTNPTARALTKRKLYYTLARWGWSPNILAFELFNEVEGTDAAHGRQWDDIAMWHREMALFLRQFDPYRHLLTTSSAPAVALDSPVWETVDYVQYHAYPPDLVSTLGAARTEAARKTGKPVFFGEFGPSGLKDAEGAGLHQGLWASLVSDMSGAGQYWDWENVEKNDLYGQFASAQKFVSASGLADHGGLLTTPLTVATTERADLSFAPGGGWGKAEGTSEFVVGESGIPSGMAQYPSYLQGQNHRDLMPTPLTLSVRMPQPGNVTVEIAQVAKAGANLKISVDGKATEKAFAAGESDTTPKGDAARISVPVGEGAHTIAIENAGKDWAQVRRIILSKYAPALAAQARMNKDFAIAWLYRRSAGGENGSAASPVGGKISLPGLQKGIYRVTWWDTSAGRSTDATEFAVTDAKTGATLDTPPIARDLACYITQAALPPAQNSKGKGKKGSGQKQARQKGGAVPAASASSTPTATVPAASAPAGGSPAPTQGATPDNK